QPLQAAVATPALDAGLPTSPLTASASEYTPLAPTTPRIFVRAQAPDPVPPPPPPPPPAFGGGGPIGGPNPGEEAFNCGVANQPKGGGGFWGGFCDRCKGIWGDVTGSVQSASTR